MIEAPGGYGKSALTAEVGSALGFATTGAVLDRHTDAPALLVSALRRGFAHAHLTDGAGAIGVGEGAVERLRAIERDPGVWYERPTGIEILAEAALLLARLRDVDGARRYLDPAEERAAAKGHEEIAERARAEFEARVGDPEPAERLLRSLFESPATAPLPPRNHRGTLASARRRTRLPDTRRRS